MPCQIVKFKNKIKLGSVPRVAMFRASACHPLWEMPGTLGKHLLGRRASSSPQGGADHEPHSQCVRKAQPRSGVGETTM